MVTHSSTDTVERLVNHLREKAGLFRAWHGYELGQEVPARLDYMEAALAFSTAANQIERLQLYVEAFRREETRADKLGQEIDDLRASLTTASGEAATAQEGWDNTAHFVGINFDDEETRTLLSEISRLRKENSDLAARLTGAAQAGRDPATIEACAKIAEAQKETFLSPQYDSNQPFGSLCERFACDEVAKAIRALAVTSPNHGGAT